MTIKIPVSADFDTSAAEQQIQQFQQKLNAMGRQIAQANKAQYTPVSAKTIEDMKKLNAQFVALQRVSSDLRKRINATGQGGASFVDLDWSKLYPDANSRNRQMQKAFTYVTGYGFNPAPGGGGGGGQPPRRPPGGGNGPSWTQAGVGAIQAGLGAANGATGGVSGVAGGALNAGLSAGAGAGLMGLLGGMLALGVGKLVGAVTEKIGQAEDNNVAYDKLKRTLGDVNVSFDGLKAVLKAAADNTRVTYSETAKLGQQFVKLGNVTTEQYKTLGSELETGIGLSRAYGLDPEQGVGAMGRARGVGFLRNEQDTRRFALLIGESIGKSGAFAKADEVMEAITDYTVSQTRQNLGAANTAGYAGMLSAMIGSGIPGLDPTGAAILMGRVNSSLTAGGAKGEASQFFTGIVGQRMGLNPLQTQILREGGAFATNDEAFGPGSIASRYGIGGPGGSTTFLQGSLDELRRQYGSNKGLLAQATANHLGVGMRQAMALLSIDPNQMGDMQKYADLTKLSGSGIGNLSKALYGSDADRAGLADSLKRRTGADALSPQELAKLEDAMKSGDSEKQKQVLAELVASRDQERTMGSDIRDSKAILDNIKTSLADKLVPLTTEIRHGIMNLAGAGKGKTPEDIMKEVLEAESKGRQNSISGKYNPQINSLTERQMELENRLRVPVDNIYSTYRDKPDVLAAKLKEREQQQKELDTVKKRIAELEKEKVKLLEEENQRRKEEITNMQKSAEERWAAEKAAREAGALGPGGGSSYGGTGGGNDRRFNSGGGGGRMGRTSGNDIASAMQYFMQQGWSREQAAGIVANLSAESGMDHGNVGDGGQAYGLAQWHPDRQEAFRRWAGKDIRNSTRAEQLAFVHYELTQGNEREAGNRLRRASTAGQAGDIVTRYYERPKYADRDAATRSAMAERIRGIQLPDEAAAELRREMNRANAMRVTVEPLKVIHENTRGEQVRPSETLSTRVGPAKPFGAGG